MGQSHISERHKKAGTTGAAVKADCAVLISGSGTRQLQLLQKG